MKKEKKKIRWWLCVLLIVVALGLAYFIVHYAIPYLAFVKESKRLDAYSTETCEKYFTGVTKRVEMSKEDYLALKEELLSEGWTDATEHMYLENGLDELSRSYFTDAERIGEKEKLIRISDTTNKLPSLSYASMYETIKVVIQDNKVYIEFYVFLSGADIKL